MMVLLCLFITRPAEKDNIPYDVNQDLYIGRLLS